MRVLSFACCLVIAGVCFGAETPFADVVLPGRNYVNNGGFERGLDGWEPFAGRTFGGVVTDEHYSGAACYKVEGIIDDYRYLNQGSVPLTPGKTYTMSAWMKAKGFARAGDNALVLNLTDYGWTKSAQLSPLQPEQDWTRHEVTFEAPPTAEQQGKPSYTLVIFWPINSEGTVWVDDIQIEEGPSATDFTDSFLGWGMQALDALRRARTEAEGLRKNLTEGELRAPAALGKRVDDQIASTEATAGQLRQYASLSPEAAQKLLADTQTLSGDISAMSTTVFLAHPYLPLSEVSMPAEQPAQLSWAMACLQGEQRATALTAANLGTRGETARLVAGDLYDETRQVRMTGLPWLTMYSSLPMRGLSRPWQRYGDALSKLGEGGTWTLLPGELNQAILVADTDALAPGTYRGEIELQSLTRQAPSRKVTVQLTVAPVRLAPLTDIAVCDIGAMADYALDSIGPLEVNTFTVSAQWLVPQVDETGKVSVDLSRVAPLVRERIPRCAHPSLWLGFAVGDCVATHLQRTYGIGTDDPRFPQVFGDWVKAVVNGFGEMGLPPEKLVFETVDEPGSGQYAHATMLAKAIKAADPRVSTHTFVTSVDLKDPAATAMYQAHDIIAPGFTCINQETVDGLRKLGKRIWVYDCQNNAETFHPVSYYRLLPWLALRYRLDGWGHFSMLNSERGRNYEPWQGVAEEALVYPDGDSQVISRRWLALQAGTMDYRVMKSLERLVKAAREAKVVPTVVARGDMLIAEGHYQATTLAKPGRDYFTGLREGADPATLDAWRDEAAKLAGELAEATTVKAEVRLAYGHTLQIDTPQPAEARPRYLCNGQLSWRETMTMVPQGHSQVSLPHGKGGTVTRCLVQLVMPDGSIYTEYVPSIPRVTADSTMPPYSAEKLNDGIAMPGMKFEPEHGWISGGDAVEHWVEARLDKPASIRGAKVWWMTFYGPPQAVKLQLWRDGRWADAPGWEQWRPATGAVQELTMPPVTTDRVRVVQQAGGGNKTFPNLMGMSEIEVLTGP